MISRGRLAGWRRGLLEASGGTAWPLMWWYLDQSAVGTPWTQVEGCSGLRVRATQIGPLALEPRADGVWLWAPADSYAAAESRARHLMALDDDLQELPSASAAIPAWPVIRETLFGLRLIQADTVFEMMVHAVLGQQVSVSAANRLRRRMMDDFNPDGADGADGVVVPRMPTPRELLHRAARLEEYGLTATKRRALLAAAEFCREEGAEARLQAAPDLDAMAMIVELPGFGRWSAEMVLMEALHRLDVWPAGDLGIREVLREEAAPRPSERTVRLLVPEFFGWRSYLAHYLWRWHRFVALPPETRVQLAGI